MISRILFLFVAWALSACGDAGQKPSTNQSEDAVAGAFVSPQQFEYGSDVLDLEANKVEAEAKDNIFVYLSWNSASGVSSALRLDDASNEEFLNCAQKQKSVDVSSGSIVVNYVYDDNGCTKADSTDTSTLKMRIHMAIECSSTDLSIYKDTDISNLFAIGGAQQLCSSDTEQKTLINVDMKETSGSVTKTATGGIMDASGQSCLVEYKSQRLMVEDGCGSYMKVTKAENGSQTKVTLLKKTVAKSVSGSANKPLFDSGSFELTINQFSGTLSTQSSGTSAKYSLSSDDGALEGSISLP